ncbi:MAG: hypothetical protein HWD82_04885 [Flavobacteriaceae bacterium]|nr:hypothetical protein [Flavobacteriaceae bacterium]
MFKTILTCIAIVFTISMNSQSNSLDFLTKVAGVYKGDLTITNTKGTQKIPMEFHLLKTNDSLKFNYRLVYNSAPRNYTLIVKDVENGILEVDENNGIILPTKHYNNTLFSFFEVQENLLSTRIEFADKKLVFEILFTNTKNKTTTGGKSKEIPEVFGYPITTIQNATLEKQN